MAYTDSSALTQIAIQLFAGNDYIEIPSNDNQKAKQVVLWGSDPWALLEACRPGIMPPGDRITGVGIGARVLCNIVNQVGAR